MRLDHWAINQVHFSLPAILRDTLPPGGANAPQDEESSVLKQVQPFILRSDACIASRRMGGVCSDPD